MNPRTVHIVDDDEAIRDALAWLFQSRGVEVSAWPSAEAFLAQWRPDLTGCLLLDVRMAGMNGLQLYEELRGRGCHMPALFLTGHGDVPLAVTAFKRGAYDFIEKPFNDNELVDRIIEALDHDAARRASHAQETTVATRLAALSAREREVMGLILAGKLNKVIADELDIAMRTVEVHRARIFEKMGVKSAVELAQLISGRL